MGRCGCSSVEAVGAAAVATECIDVSGAGTPGSPFAFTPVIDPDASNRLSCGPDGLSSISPLALEILGPIDSSSPTTGGSWPVDFTVVQFGAYVGSVVVDFTSVTTRITWPAFANGIACLQLTPGSEIGQPHANSAFALAINDVELDGCGIVADILDGVATEIIGFLRIEVTVIGW